MNLQLGIFWMGGIIPIGAGLHEPFVNCWPFEMGKSGAVRQKLMKLFDEVKDAIWPMTGASLPSCSKPIATTLESSAENHDYGLSLRKRKILLT